MILQIPYIFIIIYIRKKANTIVIVDEATPVKKFEANEESEEITNMKSLKKSVHQMEIEDDLLAHKDTFEYDEDFIAMTVLCYLKTNAEKYMITTVKQS